jgi:predicted transporter
MLLSLPVCAARIGLGLAVGGLRRGSMVLTYTLYFGLFLSAACWAARLTGLVERLLRAGPYLPALMGTVMIGWGQFLLRGLDNAAERPGGALPGWVLVLPCPACLLAVIVTSGAALPIARLPAFAVGAALGAAFVALGGLVQLWLWAARRRSSPQFAPVALALGMLVLGAYFLAILFLPAAVQGAGQVYASFTAEPAQSGTEHAPGVWVMLAAVAALGFVSRGKGKVHS